MQKTNYFFILVVILLFISSNSNAQIATPSLDATILSEFSSATGWREQSTFGATIISGVVKKDETYEDYAWDSSTNQYIKANKTKKNLTTNRDISYLLSSNPTGQLYVETFKAIQNKDDKYSRYDASGVLEYQTVNSIFNDQSQINFAYRFGGKNNGYLTAGAQYFQSRYKISYETTQDDGTGTLTTSKSLSQGDLSGMGASFSVKYGTIYMGGGMEKIDDPETTSRCANSWLNTSYGIALASEKDSGTKYRAEYSRKISAESVVSDQTTASCSRSTDHAPNEEKATAIELKISKNADWLFRYERKVLLDYSIDYTKYSGSTSTTTSTSESERQYDSYGIVLTAKIGWVFGFYYIMGQQATKYTDLVSNTTSSQSDNKLKIGSYRLNFGYVY